MEVLTFHVDTDRRDLAGEMDDDVLNLNWHDNSKYDWIQARQYEKSMRQALVKVYQGDKDNYVPMDLSNTNQILEGVMPDGKHRIYDTKDSTLIDPTGGQFRFDFPAQAFATAGSYKQIFFRIVREGTGESIATLEFNMDVMADKVISGLIPSDYITPFEDLYSKLEAILTKGDADVKKVIAEFTEKFNTLFHDLNTQGELTKTMITTCQNRLKSLEEKILQDGLFTQDEADEFKKYILGSIVQSDMVDRVINEVQTLQMTDLGPTSEPFSVDQVAQATDDGYNAGLVIGPTSDYSIEEVKSV